MAEANALEKTTRVNLLFDFYADLLTDKQRTFLACYFRDDYTLGEIAADFAITRQAVYEHIKRAGQMLEDYEAKLGLLAKHEQRIRQVREIEMLLHQSAPHSLDTVAPLLERLLSVD
ncbi:UPF0122 protein [Paenibacillus sp. J31TS4]|uniref:YlxM family DNA-binding protein n=1 Tax=Paenibacillus sp. J31TS4 TaxID=2807195 RepID=UPI001B21BF7D|nr:YlxM family DNA-binding protein [Paenibacillus sp. J31TS4]GIP36781.1 UPF0122 protein [Paenibacillus sp. J31TS4]